MHYRITQKLSILTILVLLSLSPKSSFAEIVDKILAQVNDQIVTMYEIQNYAPKRVQAIFLINDKEKQKSAWQGYYDETLQILIDNRVLEISALREGVVVSDLEVEQMIVKVAQENNQYRDYVQAVIAREGKITPELKILLRKQIIQQKIAPNLYNRTIVTSHDVSKYLRLDRNLDFNQLMYNTELAFFPDEDVYGLFAKYSKTKSFKEAVAEASGSMVEMGWLPADQMVEFISTHVKNMQPGTVSTPIKDGEGRIVVVNLIETKKGSEVPEDIYTTTENSLLNIELDRVYRNWLERSRKTIIVTRFDI